MPDIAEKRVADADIQLISRMIHEWNSGDVEALLEVFDLEVEVRPALSTFLASMVYRGHDGVRSWYAETNEPWAELQAEPQRFIDAGERTVVVIALHARVPGGRVDVGAEIAHDDAASSFPHPRRPWIEREAT